MEEPTPRAAVRNQGFCVLRPPTAETRQLPSELIAAWTDAEVMSFYP